MKQENLNMTLVAMVSIVLAACASPKKTVNVDPVGQTLPDATMCSVSAPVQPPTYCQPGPPMPVARSLGDALGIALSDQCRLTSNTYINPNGSSGVRYVWSDGRVDAWRVSGGSEYHELTATYDGQFRLLTFNKFNKDGETVSAATQVLNASGMPLSYSSGTEPLAMVSTRYIYQGSRLVGLVSNGVEMHWQYDSAGRMTRADVSSDGSYPARTILWTYDDEGHALAFQHFRNGQLEVDVSWTWRAGRIKSYKANRLLSAQTWSPYTSGPLMGLDRYEVIATGRVPYKPIAIGGFGSSGGCQLLPSMSIENQKSRAYDLGPGVELPLQLQSMGHPSAPRNPILANLASQAVRTYADRGQGVLQLAGPGSWEGILNEAGQIVSQTWHPADASTASVVSRNRCFNDQGLVSDRIEFSDGLSKDNSVTVEMVVSRNGKGELLAADIYDDGSLARAYSWARSDSGHVTTYQSVTNGQVTRVGSHVFSYDAATVSEVRYNSHEDGELVGKGDASFVPIAGGGKRVDASYSGFWKDQGLADTTEYHWELDKQQNEVFLEYAASAGGYWTTKRSFNGHGFVLSEDSDGPSSYKPSQTSYEYDCGTVD